MFSLLRKSSRSNNDKPKTASSGSYAVPIKNNYVINSNGKFEADGAECTKD